MKLCCIVAGEAGDDMSVPVVQGNGKAPNRGSLPELEGRAAEKY